VYVKYSDWARWFWKGAVHIDDVAAAVILSLDLMSRAQLGQQLIPPLDSAYEYTDADLAHWDAKGPGSTFRKYYSEYYDLALSYGLDPAVKPTRLVFRVIQRIHKRHRDMRYWAMAWGWEPWHNKYAWF
jgi:hypothetical protein